MTTPDWERRCAALWESFDEVEPAAFVEAMRALADECPTDPVALFELGGAHDSTGRTGEAVGYYRRAIEGGLDTSRRRQATIQMASSLRETGSPVEALELIEAEQSAVSDEYDGAVAMCRALTLAKLGRDREGLSAALIALAPHLPRYRRSTVNYALGLLEDRLGPVACREAAGGRDDRPLRLVQGFVDAGGGDAVEPQGGPARGRRVGPGQAGR
ncbi:tetratricopeptide repeat protein [Glycomyces tenuis]|uniref:tetratricopeptide repeat protein n=1 Tax=Glycomyces tenuis TaxID=58116 RepID=UPI0009DBD65A|nr:tetratricopeptide repeat protein [Glycomyces tenuis]